MVSELVEMILFVEVLLIMFIRFEVKIVIFVGLLCVCLVVVKVKLIK